MLKRLNLLLCEIEIYITITPSLFDHCKKKKELEFISFSRKQGRIVFIINKCSVVNFVKKIKFIIMWNWNLYYYYINLYKYITINLLLYTIIYYNKFILLLLYYKFTLPSLFGICE